MQSSMFKHKNEQILKTHRAGIERTVEQKKASTTTQFLKEGEGEGGERGRGRGGG